MSILKSNSEELLDDVRAGSVTKISCQARFQQLNSRQYMVREKAKDNVSGNEKVLLLRPFLGFYGFIKSIINYIAKMLRISKH
jgi:hypothetical protein